MLQLDQLQSNDFAPFINQKFIINLDGIEPVGLELVKITESRYGPGIESRTPFSLEFLGPVSPQYLPQHIYRLEHGEMGKIDLFLVPHGPEGGRMRYEAILA
jgi:hypothetical protein